MNNEVLSREYANYRMNDAHQMAHISRSSARRLSFSGWLEQSVVTPASQLVSFQQIRIPNIYINRPTNQNGALKSLVVFYETSYDEILCRIRCTFARLTGALHISSNSGVTTC